MALTANSRFESIGLQYSPDGGWGINWRGDPASYGYFQVNLGGSAYDSSRDADLTALRTIYASDAGFQDADGNAITVSVNSFPYGITVESIEAAGFMNPLDADSVTRAARMREFDAAVLAELASVDEDSVTARPDAAIKFGVVPTRRAAAEMLHPLNQWSCHTHNATTFSLVVDFTVADAITTDNAGERVDIQAMIRWLAVIHDSGDNVGTSPTTHAEIAEAIARGRTYNFPQAGGIVTATCVGVLYDVTRYSISFIQTETSAADHDAALMDTLLNNTEASITPVGATEEPPFGAHDVAAQASTVEFGPDHWLTVHDGHLAFRGLDGAVPYWIDLGGAGRTVNFDALADFDTASKKLPAGFGQNVIHFGPDRSADGTLRIEPPDDVIALPSGEYEVTIHNRDSAYDVDIDDWNGSEICTLHPGERITLRITRRADGTGELVNTSPFVRRLNIAGSNYGFMLTDNNWFWLHDEGAKYIRCIRMPEDSHQFSQRSFHSDAFAAGTLTYQFDGSPGVYTGANLNTVHSVNMRRAGLLRCEFQCGMYADGSGSIPQGSGLRLALQNGSSNTALRTVGQPAITAPEAMTLQTAFEQRVSHGDIIAPLWFYPNTTTVLMGSIRNVSYHLEMTLEQDISLEYVPA